LGAALLITPLIARGRRIGTIDVLLPALLDTDLSNEQRFVQMLSAHAALAIDTAATIAQAQAHNPEAAPATQADPIAPMLALLTHDLRGPLTAIDSSTQLIERTIQSTQELDRNNLIRLVALARSGIAQLKTQIDALSRPNAGQQPRPTLPVLPMIDLVNAIRLIAHFYQQTTSRHQITVSNEVAELSGPWAQAHLERMLGNLLENGIKYSPQGGTIQISINCEEHGGDRWATLSIGDTGIGIPQTDLAQIAQHGYRAHNVGAIPGTGFGLASVREIVEHYAGTLTIRSSLNNATTVQIRLPLAS
jgi:signal transduction histidine kinase